jgi:hypothetical protein
MEDVVVLVDSAVGLWLSAAALVVSVLAFSVGRRLVRRVGGGGVGDVPSNVRWDGRIRDSSGRAYNYSRRDFTDS